MHLTRVILEYVRRSIANNNLLKNRNKPKELFSKEKKMDKWQTDVWHRGKHHWWSKPQSDELSSRWVASGRGDRNVSNFRGEREEECEWVAPHADSLRTKLHDCHVIQQLHWYIPKSKKVPVLEKSSGLHTWARRALSPTLTHSHMACPLTHWAITMASQGCPWTVTTSSQKSNSNPSTGSPSHKQQG